MLALWSKEYIRGYMELPRIQNNPTLFHKSWCGLLLSLPNLDFLGPTEHSK